MTLEVSKATLIPRPDTETLVETSVEKMLEWQQTHPEATCNIAELGTGTAAIPLAFCAELQNLNIISVDCSAETLTVAARNLERYQNLLAPRNNSLKLVESDLFSAIKPAANLDFIISNPPYIPTETISTLQVDVCQYEPSIALDGGTDGLFFYKYLLKTGPSLLKRSGEMILEIGFDQQVELTELQNHFPEWTPATFLPDLQGNIRVCCLQLEC